MLEYSRSSRTMESRQDYPEAVQRIREIRWEVEDAGHEMDPAILPGLQARQRPEPAFLEIRYVDGRPRIWLCMVVLAGIIIFFDNLVEIILSTYLEVLIRLEGARSAN